MLLRRGLLTAGLLALTSMLLLAPSAALEPGSIGGQMTDEAGAPIAGVEFLITGPNELEAETQSDAAGNWAFKVESAGQYFVTINSESLPSGVGLTEPDKVTLTQMKITMFSSWGEALGKAPSSAKGQETKLPGSSRLTLKSKQPRAPEFLKNDTRRN